MLKIGQYVATHGLVLAPLAGISDSSFRRLCSSCGAELVFSEMVSAEGIKRKMKRSIAYLRFLDEERPIGLQIFGSNEESLVSAARIIDQEFGPDVIDINLGCPVRKVIKTGAGAALLKDEKRLARIVSLICSAVRTPVSAKIRLGWDSDRSVEIARILEGSGISFLTIHARIAREGYDTRAHWDIFDSILNKISIPVIANGDIRSPEDTAHLLKDLGVHAVMIGRGALGKPWIFSRMQQYLATGDYADDPAPGEQLGFLLKQLGMMEEIWGARRSARRIKKQIPYYFRGVPEGKRYVRELLVLEDFDEIRDKIRMMIPIFMLR
jgi:tRNA-dihydrouridine synthase B